VWETLRGLFRRGWLEKVILLGDAVVGLIGVDPILSVRGKDEDPDFEIFDR